MGNGSSIVGLVKEFSREMKIFVREELQLAKTEISEKIADAGSNAVTLLIGGFVGYAGLLIFLGGLGAVVAYAFNRAGMNPLLATFLGLAIIGVLVITTGATLFLRAAKAFKKAQLAPVKTMTTLQQLKGTEARPSSSKAEHREKRSSEQIQASVMSTEKRMADTLAQLTERISLRNARQQATAEVRSHPYRWGLLAAGCGAAGSYVLKRKLTKTS